MLKYFFKLVVLLFLGMAAQAQQRPTSLPTTNAPSRWDNLYGIRDSVKMSVERDTFPSKYPAMIKHLNHRYYVTDGNGAPWREMYGNAYYTVNEAFDSSYITIKSIDGKQVDTIRIAVGNNILGNLDATFGSFYSDITQPYSDVNTYNLVTLNSTLISNGVTLGSGSRITVPTSGYYQFNYKAIVFATRGITIWAKVNEIDIPTSGAACYATGEGNTQTVSGSIILNLNAGDFINFYDSLNDIRPGASLTTFLNVPSFSVTAIKLESGGSTIPSLQQVTSVGHTTSDSLVLTTNGIKFPDGTYQITAPPILPIITSGTFPITNVVDSGFYHYPTSFDFRTQQDIPNNDITTYNRIGDIVTFSTRITLGETAGRYDSIVALGQQPAIFIDLPKFEKTYISDFSANVMNDNLNLIWVWLKYPYQLMIHFGRNDFVGVSISCFVTGQYKLN